MDHLSTYCVLMRAVRGAAREDSTQMSRAELAAQHARDMRAVADGVQRELSHLLTVEKLPDHVFIVNTPSRFDPLRVEGEPPTLKIRPKPKSDSSDPIELDDETELKKYPVPDAYTEDNYSPSLPNPPTNESESIVQYIRHAAKAWWYLNVQRLHALAQIAYEDGSIRESRVASARFMRAVKPDEDKDGHSHFCTNIITDPTNFEFANDFVFEIIAQLLGVTICVASTNFTGKKVPPRWTVTTPGSSPSPVAQFEGEDRIRFQLLPVERFEYSSKSGTQQVGPWELHYLKKEQHDGRCFYFSIIEALKLQATSTVHMPPIVRNPWKSFEVCDSPACDSGGESTRATWDDLVETFGNAARAAAENYKNDMPYVGIAALPELPPYSTISDKLAEINDHLRPTWNVLGDDKVKEDYSHDKLLTSRTPSLFSNMLLNLFAELPGDVGDIKRAYDEFVKRKSGQRAQPPPDDGAAMKRLWQDMMVVLEKKIDTPKFTTYVLSKPKVADNQNMTWHIDRIRRTDVVMYMLLGPESSHSKFTVFHTTNEDAVNALRELDGDVDVVDPSDAPSNVGKLISSELPAEIKNKLDSSIIDSIKTYSVWATRGHVLMFDGSQLHGVANGANDTGKPQITFGINVGTPNGLIPTDGTSTAFANEQKPNNKKPTLVQRMKTLASGDDELTRSLGLVQNGPASRGRTAGHNS